MGLRVPNPQPSDLESPVPNQVQSLGDLAPGDDQDFGVSEEEIDTAFVELQPASSEPGQPQREPSSLSDDEP